MLPSAFHGKFDEFKSILPRIACPMDQEPASNSIAPMLKSEPLTKAAKITSQVTHLMQHSPPVGVSDHLAHGLALRQARTGQQCQDPQALSQRWQQTQVLLGAYQISAKAAVI
jgi:hypothetical protein